jgi:glutamate-1-semialdehyde 2,1-aminomutase
MRQPATDLELTMVDHPIDESRLHKTQELFRNCQQVVAGGESSYARLSNSRPIVMTRGEGAYFVDADDNRYVDWCLGYGPMIFGHRPKPIVDAVAQQITEGGMLYTFPHELDYEVGRKIVQAVPSVDLVRFANSGAEATQAAMRLARAYTGKDKILKWEGGYHGFLDCHALSYHPPLEVAGPERRPSTVRFQSGIPRSMEECVLVGPYNDLEAVEQIVKQNRGQLAAIICEPVMANAGIVPPADGWLDGLRRICDETGVLLIFDEVITGFRVSLGGAQELYDVMPDITCWGKALGGGTPCAAAFGGRREIMDVETRDEVFHGGTYNANPLVLAGINATLDILLNDRERVYGHLNKIADAMVEGMRLIFASQDVPAQVQQVGPMWQVFFGQTQPVTRYRQARRSDAVFFHHLQRECQARGVYFHNFFLERWFSSTAHTQVEVDLSLEVIETATKLAKERLTGLPELPDA